MSTPKKRPRATPADDLESGHSPKRRTSPQRAEDDQAPARQAQRPIDVVKRLRARFQPIRLFGETDDERLVRLRSVEAAEEVSGDQNDFRRIWERASRRLASEQVGVAPAEAPAAATGARANPFDGVDTTEISLELLQENPEQTRQLIAVYFKRLLWEWERDVAQQPEAAKRTTHGKLALVTQRQSAEYLRTLFKQLRRGQLAADVVGRIAEICQRMQQREYVQANDAYLRLSIGNSPWPIGVTMVGIHERSAREKIFSSQVAHVLNDEATRKWIQSVKRLMTWCQRRYPPDDKSKCVG